MIVDCGPSIGERFEARTADRKTRLSQWHAFYCLWPRRIGNRCVWLHWIRRKIRFEQDWYDGGWYEYPEYRFTVEDEARLVS